jgi:TetR/AcrR family transcriptional regulator, regulator of cefoperazone and chloramphenicol sensitivity
MRGMRPHPQTTARATMPIPANPKKQVRSPIGRKSRSDGEQARERLLQAALRLFAEKGFAKTSIRDIGQAAGVNIASISYYFGDKAGLYRAVFTEAIGAPAESIARFDQPHFTLRQSLEGFLADFLEPIKQGELVQLCMRLHFREILEPTGMWSEEIESIRPAHEALVRVLGRHLGVAKADDGLHRLAFSIAGLGVQMFAYHDVVSAIRPRLIATPAAVDSWAGRLTDFAVAMVADEAARRKDATELPSKRKA